jgi:hypothetical protein
MNFLKRSAFGLTLVFAAGAAIAQSADPAAMNAEEKATLKRMHDYKACFTRAMPAFHQTIMRNKDLAVAIADARHKAAEAATREAAITKGMPPEQADELALKIANADPDTIQGILNSTLEGPNITCMKQVGIDNAMIENLKIQALMQKYGPGILEGPK